MSNNSAELTIEGLSKRVRVLEDKEEIRRLRAKYCEYADGGWPEHGPSHMGPIADLFVEDAVWDGTPFSPLADGREAVRQMMIDYRALPFVMHYVSNADIEVDGDDAKATWKVCAPVETPQGESRLILGNYFEEYMRTAQGWLFKKIRFVATRSTTLSGKWE